MPKIKKILGAVFEKNDKLLTNCNVDDSLNVSKWSVNNLSGKQENTYEDLCKIYMSTYEVIVVFIKMSWSHNWLCNVKEIRRT